MNEQLVVKNFGPIKDATVDFKRVTVFIGPTGGGKSTLAKLAALLRSVDFQLATSTDRKTLLDNYRIRNFLQKSTSVLWSDKKGRTSINQRLNFKHHAADAQGIVEAAVAKANISNEGLKSIISYIEKQAQDRGVSIKKKAVYVAFDKKAHPKKLSKEVESFFDAYAKARDSNPVHYVPAERIFLSSIEYSWAGLMRDDIGLAEPLLNFSNSFSIARKEINDLDIDFLNAKYLHLKGRDFIAILGQEKTLMLTEAASGIQSVTPLLVLLEHLSRNTEQAQSFIIEEPELNLYPTAQQGLLNWLVEKCTKGENDLTITTHSPYLLAHFNLLLYAYQVAENHPDRADDVAKIVPRESWINPKEFAAYHVEGQQENGVRSIVNPETGLISYNGLDATANAETSEFEKLLDINAGLEVE